MTKPWDKILDEALNSAMVNADKVISANALILSLRRRIRAAHDLLNEGQIEAAKEMLKAALADDGGMLRRRFDKIANEVLGKHHGTL